MYKKFLKNINASIKDYIPLPELSYTFGIDDEKTSKKALKAITSGKTLKDNDPLLRSIAEDVFASLAYIAKGNKKERRKQVLTLVPKLSLSFASDIKLALQYITYCLDGNPEEDEMFFNYLKDRLNQKPENIPTFFWVTGYIDDSLIKGFLDKFSSINFTSTNLTDIYEFLASIDKHGGSSKLNDLYNENDDFKDLVDRLKYNLTHKQSELEVPDNDDSKVLNNSNSAVLNLISEILRDTKLLSIDPKTSERLVSNKATDEDITNLIDSIDASSKDILKSDLQEKQKNNELSDVLNEVKNKDNSQSKFVSKLFKDFGIVANNRSKKMFKLAKAYTRYYIKNMLPNMLKCAGNDPEATSKVIKVSTDEIQDLMYGDTINHPENLAEVNNPAVRDQIASDVEQAVKGDQISGGAADGLSIEDIAKKWSEIYKQVPYEHLLDVLKTQEQAGSIVEQEHTDNLEIAKEIARDHLVEAPDYYTHLENMEEVFPAENVSERPLPEPEGMDLQTLENPLPKDEEHVCDGSCGGNCKCHHDKVQTVEDKIKGLDGDGMMIIMVEETPEVETVEEQPLEFIQQIAAKIKR